MEQGLVGGAYVGHALIGECAWLQGGRNNAGRIFDDDLSGGPILRVRHDVCERQGKRPYMEDAYLVLRDFLHKVPSDNGVSTCIG